MGVLDKFLDVMKLNGDDDEYDDDFYDEDDDFEDESYEEEKPKKNIFGKKDKPAAYEEEEEDYQLKKSGRSNQSHPDAPAFYTQKCSCNGSLCNQTKRNG